jgi:hypothetical protein
MCAVGSSPAQLDITSGAGKSRSTEIIMSVAPSYGAIWSVCSHKADPERGKTIQKKIMICHKKACFVGF